MPITTQRKRISITVKRQLTIPRQFYDSLGFEDEAECLLQDDGILIRPLKHELYPFSEEILADLVSEGLSGQELLDRFRQEAAKIRPAVKKLITEADQAAETGEGKLALEDIFGPENN